MNPRSVVAASDSVEISLLLSDLVKKVLFSMSTAVLPALEHPLMLSDFLTAALNYGGIMSIVAIHGIFLLVNEHGLDYPDFYEKLYTLLTPQVFLMKYRKKFFELMYAPCPIASSTATSRESE